MRKKIVYPASLNWQKFMTAELIDYYRKFDYSPVYQAKTLQVWTINSKDGDNPYWKSYREAVRVLS